MENIGLIVVCAISVFALLGLVIGLVKGFTKVKSWANEYLLTAVITIPLGVLIQKTLGGKTEGFAAVLPVILTFGIAVVLLVLFALLSKGVAKGLEKGILSHQEMERYKQQEEMQENNEQILDALDAKDKAAYKRLSKRKFKQKEGGWGAVNRILGGLTLAVKAVTVSGLLVALVMFVLDLGQFGFVQEKLSSLYAGGVWDFFKPYLFDFLIIGVLYLCLRRGFSSGISSAVWVLVVLALVGGAGYASYYMVFSTSAFTSAATAFDANCVSQWFASLAETMEGVGITTLMIAQWIITAGIFLILLIIVILIAVFVPRLIDAAREGAAFRVADGILGAVVITAVVMGIFFFLGGMLQTASELDFMLRFNTYFEGSGVARHLYTDNVLVTLNWMPVNLADWLAPAGEVPEPEGWKSLIPIL